MKITKLAIALMFGFGIFSCQNTSNVEIKTTADSVSYVLGAFQGERMMDQFARMKVDSLIDKDVYLEAFLTAKNGEELRISDENAREFLNSFFQTFQTKQMEVERDTTGMTEAYSPDKSVVDSVSYLLGADFGKGLSESFSKDGLDTVLNLDIVVASFLASINKEELKLDTKENQAMLDVFFQKLQEDKLMAEFGDVKKEGEEYLAINRGNSDVVETASGLQYEVLVEGHGEKPAFSSRVKVHYHGTLVDGTVFDSSVDRGEPSTFGVGQVIKGWTEALQLMPVGSKWKLTIPYDIAYGTRPRPGGAIRPFETLIFEVELLEIVN